MQSMEEYLEVLTIMEELGTNLVRISSIANHLHIAPPSVVQILRKLSKSGYVTYQPKQGVSLTEKGRPIGLDAL